MWCLRVHLTRIVTILVSRTLSHPPKNFYHKNKAMTSRKHPKHKQETKVVLKLETFKMIAWGLFPYMWFAHPGFSLCSQLLQIVWSLQSCCSFVRWVNYCDPVDHGTQGLVGESSKIAQSHFFSLAGGPHTEWNAPHLGIWSLVSISPNMFVIKSWYSWDSWGWLFSLGRLLSLGHVVPNIRMIEL